MFLENRQIELIKNAIKDYNFIKEEVEFRISKDYSLEEISKVLSKFKGVCIDNLEYYDDYGYLDFEYNNVNTCVSWEANNGICMGDTFEIYDNVVQEYIVEDFCDVNYYEKLINTPKEKMLADAIVDLKHYESNGYKDSYNRQKDKIISFLKENW